MAIGCYAMGATVGYNYIRGEFLGEPVPRFEAALKEAYAAGLLGKNINGSGVDVDIYCAVGAGAYICGEETALLESLEGKQGKPRFKPPFPANFGLYGKPTTINNTQSYASTPTIMRKGAAWFAGLGVAELGRHGDLLGVRSCGQARQLRSAAGHSLCRPARAGRRHAGRAQDQGRDPRRLVLPVVPGEIMMKTNMDYDSVKAAGSAVGSAAVIVMDETTCMVKVLERLSRFYMSESCGQCTPCREGTGWLNRMLKRILAGQGRREDIDMLVQVANKIEGHTICALGDAAAWPVQSFVKHFRHEFEYMIDHGGRSIVDAQQVAA